MMTAIAIALAVACAGLLWKVVDLRRELDAAMRLNEDLWRQTWRRDLE